MEISRARDRAELVTDDAKALREKLEAVTGERIAALEGIGEAKRDARGMQEVSPVAEREPRRETQQDIANERSVSTPERGRETGRARIII